MKLFRILFTLEDLFAMFWSFKNHSLVCLFQAQADYTCWKDSLSKISLECHTKSTPFPSYKNFSVLIVTFYWLVAIKEKQDSGILKFLAFL